MVLTLPGGGLFECCKRYTPKQLKQLVDHLFISQSQSCRCTCGHGQQDPEVAEHSPSPDGMALSPWGAHRSHMVNHPSRERKRVRDRKLEDITVIVLVAKKSKIRTKFYTHIVWKLQSALYMLNNNSCTDDY